MTRRSGNYSLPTAIAERLEAALRALRNRDASAQLARFIAKLWRPKTGLFALDRRAMAKILHLGLTEDRIRAAIETLERIGFIQRVAGGEKCNRQQYLAGPEHRHNKPVLWQLSDWARAFKHKSPIVGLRPKEERLGGPPKPPHTSTTPSAWRWHPACRSAEKRAAEKDLLSWGITPEQLAALPNRN